MWCRKGRARLQNPELFFPLISTPMQFCTRPLSACVCVCVPLMWTVFYLLDRTWDIDEQESRFLQDTDESWAEPSGIVSRGFCTVFAGVSRCFHTRPTDSCWEETILFLDVGFRLPRRNEGMFGNTHRNFFRRNVFLKKKKNTRGCFFFSLSLEWFEQTKGTSLWGKC